MQTRTASFFRRPGPLSLLPLLLPGAVLAHVGIDPAVAEGGQVWRGVVRVGHGCDAAATSAIELKLPAGVSAVRAGAKSGWKVALTPQQVTWTALGAGLPSKEAGEFPVELRVPANAGPLWLTSVQRCGATTVEWSQVPASGGSTAGMKTPAALLQVMTADEAAAWRARPVVEGPWARASVPGQQSTGAFMRITAKEPTKLVGASSPVAGTAQVHEMKMENDVMRMRAVGAIDLPVGRAFELKPGGYHLMLDQLKQPLVAGGTAPVTLVFRNAKGVESRVELQVPISVQAPGGGAVAAHGDHKH